MSLFSSHGQSGIMWVWNEIDYQRRRKWNNPQCHLSLIRPFNSNLFDPVAFSHESNRRNPVSAMGNFTSFWVKMGMKMQMRFYFFQYSDNFCGRFSIRIIIRCESTQIEGFFLRSLMIHSAQCRFDSECPPRSQSVRISPTTFRIWLVIATGLIAFTFRIDRSTNLWENEKTLWLDRKSLMPEWCVQIEYECHQTIQSAFDAQRHWGCDWF